MTLQQLEETYSPAILGALRYLNTLVAEGVEFPDAVFKVTQKSGFSSHEIEALYDQQS